MNKPTCFPRSHVDPVFVCMCVSCSVALRDLFIKQCRQLLQLIFNANDGFQKYYRNDLLLVFHYEIIIFVTKATLALKNEYYCLRG